MTAKFPQYPPGHPQHEPRTDLPLSQRIDRDNTMPDKPVSMLDVEKAEAKTQSAMGALVGCGMLCVILLFIVFIVVMYNLERIAAVIKSLNH